MIAENADMIMSMITLVVTGCVLWTVWDLYNGKDGG